MRVELKSLQPNPTRDFTIDPLDEDRVDELKASIKDHGFWGGVACRRTKRNGIEVGAGWHRVKAAIKAGIREADIFVGDFSDHEMILVYAKENALQRGNVATAVAGSVAAATRFLVKGIFTGSIASGDFLRRFDLDEVRRHVESRDGLGRAPILWLLGDTPGINENTVIQQLGNLKASGDYARIVRDVQQEIEEENKEALKALERAEQEQRKAEEAARKAEQEREEAEQRRKEAAKAERAAKEEADRRRAEAEAKRAELAQQKAAEEAKVAEKRRVEAEKQMKEFEALKTTRDSATKAADKAEGREKTFDFEGVAKHFTISSHIDAFRSVAEGEGVRPYLPVNRQAALAKALVKLAKDDDVEMSSRFIRENFMSLVQGARGTQRRLDADERRALAREDWTQKMRTYQHEFARRAGDLLTAAANISSAAKKRPDGVTLHVTAEFRTAVQNIKRAVALIEKAGVA